MKRLFFAFAVLATLVSCVRENGLGAPEPRMVSLVTAETKAVLSDNDILWEDGDEVTLVFASATDVFKADFATQIEGEAVATATFRGLLDENVDEVNGYADGFAVYPSGIVADDGSVSFTVPVEQTPRENGSFADELNLASSLVDLSDLTENGKAAVHFNNALALVKFKFPENVKSVKIVSTAPLAGAADLKLSEVAGEEGRLVFADEVVASDANNTVTLLPPTGMDAFDSDVYYSVLVWPGDHELTIGLTDVDGCVDTKTVNKTMEASKSYKFNVSDKFVRPFSIGVLAMVGEAPADIEGESVALVFPSAEPGAEPLYNQTLTVEGGRISGSLPTSVAHDPSVSGYLVYPARYADEDFEPAYDQKAGDTYAYSRVEVTSGQILAGDPGALLGDRLQTVEMTLPQERVVSVKLEIVMHYEDLSVVYNLYPAEGEDFIPASASLRVLPVNDAYSAEMTFTDAEGCTKTVSGVILSDEVVVDGDGFTKEVALAVTGVEAGETVKVLFASDVWGEDCQIMPTGLSMKFPCGVYNSGAKGIAVWADDFTGVPSDQTVPFEGSLKTAALDMAAVKAGTQTSAVFADALATVNFTLPADVASVKIDAGDEVISGAAGLGVNDDGSLKVEWGSGASGTITSAGEPVVMLPGTYDLKITLTDSHGCTSVSDHEGVVLAAGTNTLVLDGSFMRTFTLSVADGGICPADAQIAVVFTKDGEAPVVHKMTMSGGQCSGQISDQVTEGNGYAAYAVYPAERVADDGTVTYEVQAGNMTGAYSIAKAAVDLSAIEASGAAALDFKSLLQTLSLTLPSAAEKVTLTSTKPLGGTLSIAADGTVAYPASGNQSVDIVLTGSAVEVTVFDVDQTFGVDVFDGDGCKFVKTGLSGYSHELTGDFKKYITLNATGVPTDEKVFLKTAYGAFTATRTAVGVYSLEIPDFHGEGTTFCAVAYSSSMPSLEIPAAQSGNESYVLSTCVIPAEDFEDNQVTAALESRLQALDFTLPAGVVKVTVRSSDSKEIAGRVNALADGSLQIVGGSAEIVYSLSSASAADDVCTVTAIEGAASYDIILEDGAENTLTFYGKTADQLDFSDETFIQPVTLNPTAVASHVYSGGTLTGSQVVLNLGASAEDLARIRDLDVKVISGGTTYKSYTSATVSSNEVTLTGGGKVYMPRSNTYTADITWSDELGSHTQSVTCSGPGDPTFSYITEVESGFKFIKVSARVNISQEVLSQVPVTASLVFRGSASGNTSNRTVLWNQSFTVPTILSDHTISDLPQDSYKMVQTFAKFDGIETAATHNNQSFTVTDVSYKRASSPLNDASKMTNGGLYVIVFDRGSNAGKYWYNNNGSLAVGSVADSNQIPEEYVFVYRRADDRKAEITVGKTTKIMGYVINQGGNYSHLSAGSWESKKSSGQYITEGFAFGTSPFYFTIVNGWRNNETDDTITSNDFDMYKNTSDMVNYNGSFYWGHGNEQEYKWNIYPVTENNN